MPVGNDPGAASRILQNVVEFINVAITSPTSECLPVRGQPKASQKPLFAWSLPCQLCYRKARTGYRRIFCRAAAWPYSTVAEAWLPIPNGRRDLYLVSFIHTTFSCSLAVEGRDDLAIPCSSPSIPGSFALCGFGSAHDGRTAR